MSISDSLPSLHISLGSEEAIGLWDIATDQLWMTAGMRTRLGLTEHDACMSMGAFLSHVPPASTLSLNEARESVLSGVAGSCVEAVYPFDTLQVHECLMVIARDPRGRAVRAIAQYTVKPLDDSVEEAARVENRLRQGFWMISLAEGCVWRDAHCNALEGLEAVPTRTSTDDIFCGLHPEDVDKLRQSYFFMKERPDLYAQSDHVVRMRIPDGDYKSMLVRWAILGRDEQGKPTHIGGTLSPVRKAERRHDLTFQDSRKLLFAVHSTGDGLWDWDAATDSVYYSPQYLSMLGYKAGEFPPNLEGWQKKIHPDDHDKIVYPQIELVASPRYGETFECTYRLQRKDGTYAWILGRGYVTHRDAQGRATHVVGMHTDITTVQSEREKLEDMVKNDTLTGLRSRAYCNLEIERIERSKVRPICVFSLDVTGLKLINDSLGHAAGDQLLTRAALLVRAPLRAMDCVARMGGDEFVVLLPGCTPENGKKMLQQMQRCFAEHNADGTGVPIRVALGMAFTSSTDVPLAALLRDADAAMLKDKRRHRTEAHKAIKDWIEQHHHIQVNFIDSRL